MCLKKLFKKRKEQVPRNLYVLYETEDGKRQVPESVKKPGDIYVTLAYHAEYPQYVECTPESDIRFTVYDDVLNTYLSPDVVTHMFSNANIGTDSPDDVENFIAMIAELNNAKVIRGYAHPGAVKSISQAKSSLDLLVKT